MSQGEIIVFDKPCLCLSGDWKDTVYKTGEKSVFTPSMLDKPF
ncbi:hypothetical protein [Caproiciproducens sp. LBM24188]